LRRFALPEILVAAACAAVLAAVVVPPAVRLLTRSDDSRFQIGATDLRTGITAFVSDTSRRPGRVSDLYRAPAATDVDLDGAAYGEAVSRWRGPYMSGALAVTDSLSVALAFIQNPLRDSSLVATDTSGFVVASLSGVTTQATAAHLDMLIDASTGPDAGVLQWQPSAGVIADGAVKLQVVGSR
jgi:type II secretory pathway pseudopilin PulG